MELGKLPIDQQTNIILKYLPDETPSPRVWLELVKTQVLGVDKTGRPRPIEDLLFFLSTCHRSQLDPLARQIYAVYRWDSRAGREKMTIQISIDGMRLIAQRSGFYGGQDDAMFVPADESAEHPTKATVTVYRLNTRTGERMPVSASARWNEYVPTNRDGTPTGLWNKMPYLMLAKVAEALALRKAFPQELSGLYSGDEMEQAGPVVEATARQLSAETSTTEDPGPDPEPPAQPEPEQQDQPIPEPTPAQPAQQDPSRQPEPPATPAQAAAGQMARPWSSGQVIEAIRKTAAIGQRKPGKVEVNGRYGVALGLLDKVCKEGDHHHFLQAVFGVQSAKDLAPEQRWALTMWADPYKPTDDDPWQFRQHVAVEATRVIMEVLHPDEVPF